MAKKTKKKKEHVQKKDLLFRGKSIEELQMLDVRESAKFLKARPRRSVLRNFDTIEKFLKVCSKKQGRNKKIKTHLREIVIVPKLVGLTIQVHNGQNFQEVPITLEMIGHRLGEFAPTRTIAKHTSMGIGGSKSTRSKKK